MASSSSSQNQRDQPKRKKLSPLFLLPSRRPRISRKENDTFRTDFCLQIAKKVGLEKAEQGSNFVISPILVHASLSMIAAGSTGRTLEQLLSFLNLKNINDLSETSSQLVGLLMALHHGKANGVPVFSVANSIWVHKRFHLNPHFRDIVCGQYQAEAKETDFENKGEGMIKEVVSWVENATNAIIKDVLPRWSINSKTGLLLPNALYFKGVWDQGFHQSQTQERAFHLLNEGTVQVPFMTSYPMRKYLLRCFNDFQVLKLPYQNGRDNRQFSMYFFLSGLKNGLSNLIEKLYTDEIGFFNQHFEFYEKEVKELAIPRFKIAFGFEASKALTELGLSLPFLDIEDLGGIADSVEGLHLSNIFHGSCIEINECGTVAASTHSSIFGGYSRRPEIRPPSFVADHPFVFMIREETSRMVFFTGAVLSPSLISWGISILYFFLSAFRSFWIC